MFVELGFYGECLPESVAEHALDSAATWCVQVQTLPGHGAVCGTGFASVSGNQRALAELVAHFDAG